jgi:hypothetical protein
MTGTNCDLFTHKSSRSYLNHLVFSHYLKTARFSGGGGGVIKHKMCVLIFSATLIRNIDHFRMNAARYDHNCS